MLQPLEGMTIEERRDSFVTYTKDFSINPNVNVVCTSFESFVGLPYLEVSLKSSNQRDFNLGLKAILAKGKELSGEVNVIDTTPVIFVTGTQATVEDVIGMFKSHRVEFDQDSLDFEESRTEFKVKFTLTFR